MLSSNRRFFDRSVKTVPIEKLYEVPISLSGGRNLSYYHQLNDCLVNRYDTFRRAESSGKCAAITALTLADGVCAWFPIAEYWFALSLGYFFYLYTDNGNGG